jgi:carbon storage regulator CsrA
MLVLSRRVGEQLIIDGNICVTVSKVSGNRVSLGISAPNDVRILRSELEPNAPSYDGRQFQHGPSTQDVFS